MTRHDMRRRVHIDHTGGDVKVKGESKEKKTPRLLHAAKNRQEEVEANSEEQQKRRAMHHRILRSRKQ